MTMLSTSLDAPLTATAFDRLRRSIVMGDLAPGAPLRLAGLSARYGISATPLREALSRLEQMRLVVASPNRGWRVAPVSLAELTDLENARLTIETSLLQDAIAQGTVDWEAGIVAAHHRLGQTPLPLGNADATQRRAWFLAHEGFHNALLAAARSTWLKRYHAETSEQLERHHQALLRHRAHIVPGDGGDGPDTHRTEALLRRAMSLKMHTALMQATLARDAPAALARLAEHVAITRGVFAAIAGAPLSHSQDAAGTG